MGKTLKFTQSKHKQKENMKVSDAFPSKYLSVDDLKGKATVVTIESVELETMGKGREASEKLIISFKGKSKSLVANKTNSKVIAKLHGDDTDDWIGKQIRLVPREVEFQGDMVWAIRVSLQSPGSPAPEPEPEQHAEEEELGGEVPF